MYLLLDGKARCATAALFVRFKLEELRARSAWPTAIRGRVLQAKAIHERYTFSEVRESLSSECGGLLDILETIRSGALSKEGFNFFFLPDQEVVWVWWTGVNWSILVHPDKITNTDYCALPGSLVFDPSFSTPESVAA